MNSADRLLGILKLFTVAKPVWAAEEAAKELEVSISQTYRYFKSLAKAGLLDPISEGVGFTLGPAFIEYDRQIQACDPMLQAARPVMLDLSREGPSTATVLLCRRYHERVMCVHQVVGQAPQAPISYERGLPMPMLRGASSKVILANLPQRVLKRVHAQHAAEIAGIGLGVDWPDFKTKMGQIRRLGYSVSFAEIDEGRVGLGVAILDDKGVLGSIAFALLADEVDDKLLRRLVPLTVAAAREIEAIMQPHLDRRSGAPPNRRE